MPALGDQLRHRIRVTLDGKLSPAQLGNLVGTIAKTRHEQLMRDGKVPQTYQRYVNGQLGASETSIRLAHDGTPGTILYKGSSLAAAIVFARTLVQELSPKRSGAYARSWLIMINDQVYSGPIDRIPTSVSKAVIVNFAPYSRRLEQSFGRSRPGYHITQIAVDTTKRRFGGLTVTRRFVTLPSFSLGGFSVPYRLVRPPGGEMLYPAISIGA